MLKDNLALLRNMHGYSQEELAERIGISRQAYGKWESGATIPDIEKCQRLAEVYGTTIDSLVGSVQLEGIGLLPPAPKGKNVWGVVTINERGQIVIPKAAREAFSLSGGQRLVVASDEMGIALLPVELFENRMRAFMDYAARNGESE
ncbi:MAG: helix-turn-helix domain-containing protein [Eggerthellaceae bacterium]|nr:helix-turn-helix domain-containing protein [Eggerthellaceae bacterium]